MIRSAPCVLDPADERARHVEHLRPGAAGTVEDPGGHEQACEPLDLLRAVERVEDALVIVDRAFREDQLVAPTVPEDRLPAAWRNPDRFGSSVPMTSLNSACDSWNVDVSEA